MAPKDIVLERLERLMSDDSVVALLITHDKTNTEAPFNIYEVPAVKQPRAKWKNVEFIDE